MRVIVTGASGFIGKELCSKLLERGHQVVGLSRTRGASENTSVNFFQHIPYVMGEKLPSEVISFSPEVLVHLAWNGIPDFSERKCLDNVESQLRFLKETEKLHQLKKIVAAGTCREYGAKEGACAEWERVQPDSYFSWAKQTLADYFKLACQQRQTKLVWFRIFYIYGPGQRAASLIPSLIKAFKSKLKPEIRNANAANDYIYIDDVVSAFINSIENNECQGIFNLGSGALTSVAKISDIVERTIQNDVELSKEFDNQLDLDVVNTGMWSETLKSRNQLGWKPKISLVDGIHRTYRSALT
jgi:dTDP-6-deoxy-L-talose 4-dehydrogenase (NAD+)